MKKVTIISLVLVLLAASVVPVMAGNGTSNGHGNGVSTGQANNHGGQPNTDKDKNKERNQETERNQEKEKNLERKLETNRNRERNSFPGFGLVKNQQNMWMNTPFYLQGEITAVDTVTGTLTVNLIHANAKVKQFLGTDLTIKVTEGTMIFQITQGDDISGTVGAPSGSSDSMGDTDDDGEPSNRIPITLDQLEVGQRVAIHGNLIEDLYTARLITVYIRTPLGEMTVEEP